MKTGGWRQTEWEARIYGSVDEQVDGMGWTEEKTLKEARKQLRHVGTFPMHSLSLCSTTLGACPLDELSLSLPCEIRPT